MKVWMILPWGREPETELFVSGVKMMSLVHLWEMVPWHIYTMLLYVHGMTFQCFIFPFCVHSMSCINLNLSYQFLSITAREKWIGWLQFFTCAKHMDFAFLAHLLFWCSARPVSLGWSPDNAPKERPLTAGSDRRQCSQLTSQVTLPCQLLLKPSTRVRASPCFRNSH